MSAKRQYNVAKYDIEWHDGNLTRKPVLCYRTWVTLPEARQRLGPNGGRGEVLVYRDISDWHLSREPWSGRLYLYDHDRALYDQWDNAEDWHRYDEVSIGEGAPLEGWATRLFEAMGPDRAKSVHRALSRVLHPDNPTTGDDALWRELNGAYEGHTNPEKGNWLDGLFDFGRGGA